MGRSDASQRLQTWSPNSLLSELLLESDSSLIDCFKTKPRRKNRVKIFFNIVNFEWRRSMKKIIILSFFLSRIFFRVF